MLVFDNGTYRIHQLVLGPIRTNCYIVETRSYNFVLDPVGESEVIEKYLEHNRIEIRFLLATHAHFDHVAAAADLIERGFCSRFYVHEHDLGELKRAKTYSIVLAKKTFRLPERVSTIDSEFEKELGECGLVLSHLPGHTKGSFILYPENKSFLFSGDLIVHHWVANPKPNPLEDRRGLRAGVEFVEKNFAPRTLVFPGHGRLTLLGTELAFNKTIKYLKEAYV